MVTADCAVAAVAVMGDCARCGCERVDDIGIGALRSPVFSSAHPVTSALGWTPSFTFSFSLFVALLLLLLLPSPVLSFLGKVKDARGLLAAAASSSCCSPSPSTSPADITAAAAVVVGSSQALCDNKSAKIGEIEQQKTNKSKFHSIRIIFHELAF